MAIAPNVQLANFGSRVSFVAAAGPAALAPPAPAAAQPAPSPVATSFAPSLVLNPSVIAALSQAAPQLNGGAVTPTVRPIIPLPIFPPPIFGGPLPAPPKITTALALAAIDQLHRAAPTSVRQAINALTSLQLTPDGVMDYLVRKVNVSEVLGQTAEHWVQTTQNDFGDAFHVQPGQFETMDSIVSIAILNDRDLETELRAENTPPATPGDLLQNRRVIWQWPAPGTVLNPPYVMLVAVDSQDTSAAADVVQGILGQLAAFQTYKLPKTVIPKLG